MSTPSLTPSELYDLRRAAIERLNKLERARKVTLTEYQRLRWAIEGAQTEDAVQRIEEGRIR